MSTFKNVTQQKDHAIVGVAEGSGIGVHGTSTGSTGTGGVSENSIGVHGVAHKGGPGVRGDCSSGVGVFGASETSTGVGGVSKSGIGIHGLSETGPGVVAATKKGPGLMASSDDGEGSHTETNSGTVAAVAAFNRNPNGTGAAVYGEKAGDVGHAGYFVGDVHVTRLLTVDGDIELTGADLAEDFRVGPGATVDPGTVMVLVGDGVVTISDQPYDCCVAGVVTGAGTYRPGLILNRKEGADDHRSLALVGRVYCKVDASYAPVVVGDLLTTSATPGHAMKAAEREQAFGAVLGKAMAPLPEGRGLISVLVGLQ